MAIYGLWVINKAGGLVYQRNFAEGLALLSSNEYLVLAGTLHGIHAITSRLSPIGPSSGAKIIEGETFKMTILLTATGTKFVLLTSLSEVSAEIILQRAYDAYADAVMKNPFHTPEMPIRSEGFDIRITNLIGAGTIIARSLGLQVATFALEYMRSGDLGLREVESISCNPSHRIHSHSSTEMQAQTVRNDCVTSSQSLAAIQTLLRAGLGCITFLRNLLPDENFTESHFTAAGDPDASSDSSMTPVDHVQRRNVAGFKIMTMTRGYTEEADRILNYLEYGIFDALQKQYLRSFIFAIYLDSKDPNNIAEAYTFNFRYHNIPGTDTVVPILSLGDGLQKMSLQNKDPVTEAVLKGKVPTLREVKKSVKALLKTLIHAMTQMDVLPKRRFATFKLFYTDKTPLDYEPPHFQAGDAEKDKWYFMTHDLDEVPDRWSIGRVNTGHHSVNLSVTSIATYLPSSTRLDGAIFGGITQSGTAASLTPEQEACIRTYQVEEQLNDADSRNIAWSVEDNVELFDIDADGEDDPDYKRLADGTYEKKAFPNTPDFVAPVGIINDRGIIEPFPMEVDLSETCFGGVTEIVPTRLAELAGQGVLSGMEQTQSIEDPLLTPPADKHVEEESTVGQYVSPEPQFVSGCSSVIKKPSSIATEQDNPSHDERKRATSGITDKGLDCECGVTTEDDCCFCEGGCGRWYHVWCMGYHSAKDTRMPIKFGCFDCRLRADLSWDLVKTELYPMIISKLKELALFRRAIKVAELKKPTTLIEFSKFFDNDHGLARQLFKRLESEGFIFDQSTGIDDFGLTETHVRNTRNKAKTKGKGQKRKVVQKSTFAFNRAIKTSQVYLDHFNPDPDIESRLMGLSELRAGSTISNTRDSAVTVRVQHQTVRDDNSQTQEETQLAALANLTLDARHDQEIDRPRKRIKISVAMGVDLAE